MTTQAAATDNLLDSCSSRRVPTARWFVRLLSGLICVLSTIPALAQFPSIPSLSDLNPFSKDEFESLDDKDLETTVTTPMIGDHTRIGGNTAVRMYGIGLVVNLKGTGDDPPISTYRSQLKREMSLKGIKDANNILRSPNTTLVEVKAYLPPLVKKGDTFDVEVHIPGNSEATDLHGGWLLETYLTEVAPIPGEGIKKGDVLAIAGGPIMVSTDWDQKLDQASLRKRGKILGGGRSLRQREMKLYLNNDFRSVRNAKRISDRIGNRFFHYDEYGIRESMGHAKTDTEIDLKIMPQYEDNHARYINVIRHIAFRETAVARNVRVNRLKDQLLNPRTSERTSIELEAIGMEAVPILEAGLKSEWLEVRFHSAMALAYIGETTGLDVLAEAAEKEHAFRIYAFAAMAAVEDVEAHMKLRDMINKADIVSAETRYGAFRALSTLDENDPYIRGEKLNDQFMLHEVATEGPPMIHFATRKKAEIVIFGKHQKFRTPLVLRAGKEILIKGDAGNETVTISNFHLPEREQQKVVSTDIATVIRTVVEMGATYPDVTSMLFQAETQENLPGRLEMNALPKAGQIYYRPRVPSGVAEKDSEKIRVRVGNGNNVPNIFSEQRDNDAQGTRSDDGASYDEITDEDDSRIEPVSGEKEADDSDAAQESGKPRTSSDNEDLGAEPTEEELKKTNYIGRKTRLLDFRNPFKRGDD